MIKITTTAQHDEDCRASYDAGFNFATKLYQAHIHDAETLIGRLERHIFGGNRNELGQFIEKPSPANDVLKYRREYGQRVDMEV